MKPLFEQLEFWPVGQEVSLREAFGRVLCFSGSHRDDFVLFDADVSGGTGAKPFVSKFSDRVVQFGIAEQNMMAAAAGFSDSGIIPVVSTFAAFGMMRAHEQFRTTIAYPNRNVKVCCSHVGLDVGPDGATAQMLEDLAVARSIPNVTVVVPADANEFMLAFPQVLDHPGPVYMRVGRSPAPVFLNRNHRFRIGQASILQKGFDVTIVAAGVMVGRALEAAKELEKEGVSTHVINLSTIKPLDSKTVLQAAKETGCVVTAEDHTIHGGVGSAVAEFLATTHPVPIEMVAVKDLFGKSGEPDELAKLYNLTARDVALAAQKVMKRKMATVQPVRSIYS